MRRGHKPTVFSMLDRFHLLKPGLIQFGAFVAALSQHRFEKARMLTSVPTKQMPITAFLSKLRPITFPTGTSLLSR